MEFDKSSFWLVAGIVLVVAGGWLLVEFIVDFASLILGIIAVLVGLQFISISRRPRIKVK